MNIDVILFDMGGTLEDVRYSYELRRRALPGILNVLDSAGITLSEEEETLLNVILSRNAEYKAWSEAREVELSALDIWADWNLRDFNIPHVSLEPVAEELAYLWETTFFARSLRPDAEGTLRALSSLGYRLGIISNTSSRTQVFRSLDAYGIADCFDNVVLSSIEGVRKPAREIFDAAVKAMGTESASAAYVGDTLSRDVIGSKRAGFALAIQIQSFLTASSDVSVRSGSTRPDYLVTRLGEIVDILGGVCERRQTQCRTRRFDE